LDVVFTPSACSGSAPVNFCSKHAAQDLSETARVKIPGTHWKQWRNAFQRVTGAMGKMRNCGMRYAEGKMRNGMCGATVIGRDVTSCDFIYSAFHHTLLVI